MRATGFQLGWDRLGRRPTIKTGTSIIEVQDLVIGPSSQGHAMSTPLTETYTVTESTTLENQSLPFLLHIEVGATNRSCTERPGQSCPQRGPCNRTGAFIGIQSN